MSSPTPFPSPSPSTLVIDRVTILSLLATLILLIIAYLASLRLLRPRTTLKFRILFIWHAFDALIHLILESAFLYNCFFTYTSILSSSDYPHPASLTSPGVYFLGRKDRLYGSNYGSNPMAKVWQEYAKADSRWGGADLTVISLEILTVCIGGPLAVYVCELIRRGDREGGGAGGKLWFWATVLATGELYGGFMTFAPEWLTGSPNLDTSNFMYLWVYLFFFNTLWVWFPLWVLYEAHAYGSRSGVAFEEGKESLRRREEVRRKEELREKKRGMGKKVA